MLTYSLISSSRKRLADREYCSCVLNENNPDKSFNSEIAPVIKATPQGFTYVSSEGLFTS